MRVSPAGACPAALGVCIQSFLHTTALDEALFFDLKFQTLMQKRFSIAKELFVSDPCMSQELPAVGNPFGH